MKSILPLIDFIILYVGLSILTRNWEKARIEFPDSVIKIAIPIYTLIWMISILFNGGYDAPLKLTRFIKGTLIGTFVILVFYALLPKSWQFSRLYILLGAAWFIGYYLLSRIYLHFAIKGRFNLRPLKHKKFAIVGTFSEFKRVQEILKQTNDKIDSISFVSITETKEESAIGVINQLDQITHIHKIDEVVFCAKDTSARTIIHWMSFLDSKKLDFKIAQPDSLSLIGSNSIETAGDLYVMNVNSISKTENQRVKRVFDVIISSLLLGFSPILILFYSQKRFFLRNCINILIGKNSVIGYSNLLKKDDVFLPKIKPGILNPSDNLTFKDEILSDKLNLIYARDYSINKDIAILIKSWRQLDR